MAAEIRRWTCPSPECGGKEVTGLGGRLESAVKGHLLLTHNIPRDSLQGEIEEWDLSVLTGGARLHVEPPVTDGPDQDPTGGAEPPANENPPVAVAAQFAEFDQRLDDVEKAVVAQASNHGLCTDPRCLICRRDKVVLAQEGITAGRTEFTEELDEAAVRYGLEPQRDLLADAVVRLRQEKSGLPVETGESEEDPVLRITG